MTTFYFPRVNTWVIPDEAIRASFRELAVDGLVSREGVALWLGQKKDGVATVTHVVTLRCSGVVREPLALRISSAVMNDVTDLAIQTQSVLVGQIHSHPGMFIDLSLVDRTDGIAVPDYLSVVAPRYGTKPVPLMADCGFHVFEEPGGFRQMSSAEVGRRVLRGGDQCVHSLVVAP